MNNEIDKPLTSNQNDFLNIQFEQAIETYRAQLTLLVLYQIDHER